MLVGQKLCSVFRRGSFCARRAFSGNSGSKLSMAYDFTTGSLPHNTQFPKDFPVMADIGKVARSSLTLPKAPFSGNIVVLGCGAVTQCMLPLLENMIDTPHQKVHILDMIDTSDRVRGYLEKGAKFSVTKITRDNLEATLAKYLKPGDLLIDLAWEISTLQFLRWCRANKVLFVNASVEIWDPYMDPSKNPAQKFTLYDRHMDLRKMIKEEWGNDNSGPTAVLDHGANPGMVSHFTKLALEHIAWKIQQDKPNEPRTKQIEAAWKEERWNDLAHLEGVKVIHISERDTQVTKKPKQLNEFVNTWSPEGFYEEGVAPAELGWGTHEKKLPPGGLHHTVGPQNQICIESKGMNTWVRSWVPTGDLYPGETGDILGMVIRHGEAFTITDRLTVWKEGKAIYRPTVHYSYCPCDQAIASLQELRMRHYDMQDTQRVLHNDIESGADLLGVLLMGHDYRSWWLGSLLDIHEARTLVPNQNATVVQVATSMASAVRWVVLNQQKGVCVPDDLPHREILRSAWPTLGPCISRPVDWSPRDWRLKEAKVEYRKDRREAVAEEDEWQFTTFLHSQF